MAEPECVWTVMELFARQAELLAEVERLRGLHESAATEALTYRRAIELHVADGHDDGARLGEALIYSQDPGESVDAIQADRIQSEAYRGAANLVDGLADLHPEFAMALRMAATRIRVLATQPEGER